MLIGFLAWILASDDKVSISSLQAANEGNKTEELRQKRIEEASASTSRSAEIETLVNEDTIDSGSFNNQEVHDSACMCYI